jgi:hypothetical protein
MHEFERPADAALDVLGEIAARHALVDVLVTGQRVELLDAGLDVVPRHPLACGDRVEVDLLEHPLVVGDGLIGDVDPEFLLRPQHRQPQPALGDDLGLRDHIATISALAYRLAQDVRLSQSQLTALVRQGSGCTSSDWIWPGASAKPTGIAVRRRRPTRAYHCRAR